MPRLSTVHPYPAMMPDELVTSLVGKYGGNDLLDPFCGTGRVCMAMAEAGGAAVGMDVNPLAVLIARAKSHSDGTEDLEMVLDELLEARQGGRLSRGRRIDRFAGRRVEWYGQQAAQELGEIVSAIDLKRRSWSTQLMLAAVLSATAREVSFARRDQWKLHRLRAQARANVRQDAWSVFERRLRNAWREIFRANSLAGTCTFALGQARDAPVVLRQVLRSGRVDAIITSPPYGDSQSTVQYGGMSSLCLDVVSRIRDFEAYGAAGSTVDRVALGGRLELDTAEAKRILAGYWAGSAKNGRCRRAGVYLRDLQDGIRASAACLRPGGLFVTVVARRLIGGWRLRTDVFVADTLEAMGFAQVERKRRRIVAKVTPPMINRMARRAAGSGRVRVRTMREEWILVHRAPGHLVASSGDERQAPLG